MGENAQGERAVEADLLSAREIGAAFPLRFPDFRCTVCGTEDFFSLDTIVRKRQDFGLYKDVLENASTSNLETIEIACVECGHIYRFLEFLLLRSLKKAGPDAATSRVSQSGS